VGPLNQGNFLFFVALLVAVKIEHDSPSTGKAKNFRNLYICLLLSFAAINLLSVFLATDAPGMAFTDRNNDYIYGLAITAALGLGLREMSEVSRVLMIMMILFGVFYAAELLTLPFRFPYLDGRFIGIREYNANIMAMNLLMMFAIYFASIFRLKTRFSTLLCVVAAGVSCALLFLTRTRFALLTMIFFTVPTSLVLQRRFGSKKHRLVTGLLIVFLVAPVGSYLWWHNADANRKSFKNMVTRFESWQGALRIMSMSEPHRVIIGHGNMEDVYGKLQEPFQLNIESQKGIVHTHNVVVQTFLESGILGTFNLILIWTLAWVGVFAIWIKNGPGGLGLEIPLATSLTTIAVMGQMDYPLWSINGKIAWCILGLSYAFIQITIREKSVSH